MPVNADPDEIIKFSLATDADKPEAERPTFLIRFRTIRESSKFRREAEPIYATDRATEDGIEKYADALSDIIIRNISGWTNMRCRGVDVPFPSPLPDFLTDDEIVELFRAVRDKPTLEADDRKKSSSPAISEQAASAKDAVPSENA